MMEQFLSLIIEMQYKILARHFKIGVPKQMVPNSITAYYNDWIVRYSNVILIELLYHLKTATQKEQDIFTGCVIFQQILFV